MAVQLLVWFEEHIEELNDKLREILEAAQPINIKESLEN